MKKTPILFAALLVFSLNCSFGAIKTVETSCPPHNGKTVSSASDVDPGDLIKGSDLLKDAKNNSSLKAELERDVKNVDPNAYYSKNAKTKKWQCAGNCVDEKNFKAEEGSKEDDIKADPPTEAEQTVYSTQTGDPLTKRDRNLKYEDKGNQTIATDPYGNKAVFTKAPAETAYEFYDKDGNLVHSIKRPAANIEAYTNPNATDKDGKIIPSVSKEMGNFSDSFDGTFYLQKNTEAGAFTGEIVDGYQFRTPETEGKETYAVTLGEKEKIYFDKDGKFVRSAPYYYNPFSADTKTSTDSKTQKK